jgi:hypothetical protein
MVAHALTAEINRAVALRQREQYAKRKPAKGQKELQWITIGGTPDGDKKHAGGTPVQITKTGRIVKGPAALTGHKVDELGKGTREKNEAKANAEHKAETAAAKKPAKKKLDTKPAEASGSERKPAEVDPQTTTSKHPRDHIRDLLSDGKNRDLHEIRAHMRDEHGIDGKHDHDNPQSHPVNAALKDLAEEGAISVHDPRYGAPSFHMNEDQQNRYRERTKADEDSTNSAGVPADGSPDAGIPEDRAEIGRPQGSLTGDEGASTAGGTGDGEDEILQPGVEDGQGSEQPATLFDTPREAAEKATEQARDEEYDFARKSEFQNAGEDLLGSARHKRNEWRGLAQAEQDGTAESLVTRDNLAKAEPHDLAGIIDDVPENHRTAAVMALALRKFPAKPGPKQERHAARRSDEEKQKDRRQFVESYQLMKAKAEEIARDENDPLEAVSQLRKWIESRVLQLRGQGKDRSEFSGTDKYNSTANLLIDTYKAMGKGNRWDNATSVASQAKDIESRLAADSSANPLEASRAIAEGAGIAKAFGDTAKKKKQITQQEFYENGPARRKGGRDVARDPHSAIKGMLDTFGLRGLQWGNSVTDDERKYHAVKATEALSDLADIIGLDASDIAIEGNLGLAIGARGRGGALAHYERESKVINLTRNNGVGSLAHEWGHFFDHAMGEFKAMGIDVSHRSTTAEWVTEDGVRRLKRTPISDEHGIRSAYNDLYSAMRPFRDRLKDTVRDMVTDGAMSAKKATYWQSDVEVFARCFERHVQREMQSQDRENTYLVALRKAKGGLWPDDAESEAMSKAFSGLFEAFNRRKQSAPEKYSMQAMFERAFAVEREQYAKRKSAPGQKTLKWITLKNDDGGGGTHVQIDGKGHIQKGPQSLTGHKVGELGAAKRREHEAKVNEPETKAHKPAAVNNDNPFRAKHEAVQRKADQLAGGTAQEKAMAESFPLGGGFGHGSERSRSKAVDASVDRATRAVEASKQAKILKAQADAFDRGEINASGRAVNPNAKPKQPAAPQGRNHARQIKQGLILNGTHTLEDGTKMSWATNEANAAKPTALVKFESPDGSQYQVDTGVFPGSGAAQDGAVKAAKQYIGGKLAPVSGSESKGNSPELKSESLSDRIEAADPIKRGTQIVDFGPRQRGQGRRIGGGMIVGSGTGHPGMVGKQEYPDSFANVPDYKDLPREQKTMLNNMEPIHVDEYLKARGAGLPHMAAAAWAISDVDDPNRESITQKWIDEAAKQEKRSEVASAPAQFKPAPVPGQQMGLFGQTNSGQGQLFNIAKPGKRDAKAAAQASMLEQIEDSIKKREAEAAPLKGQREMFARRLTDEIDRAVGVERYSANWDESKHPRDNSGKFISEESDTYWRLHPKEFAHDDVHGGHTSELWTGDDPDSTRKGLSTTKTLEELVSYFAGWPGETSPGRSLHVGDSHLVQMRGDESGDEPYEAAEGEKLIHPNSVINSVPLSDTDFMDRLTKLVNKRWSESDELDEDQELEWDGTEFRPIRKGTAGFTEQQRELVENAFPEAWELEWSYENEGDEPNDEDVLKLKKLRSQEPELMKLLESRLFPEGQTEKYEAIPTRRRERIGDRPQPQVTVPQKSARQPGDGSAGWQRVGGAPVFVSGDGKITKGCPGLKGEHVSDLIDEPDDSRERREVRQAHAKAEGIDGKQYSASDRRRHETKKTQAAHANAKAAAKQHGVATHEVLKEMPAQHEATSFEDRETEAARKRARQMTGLTAGRQAAIENRYEDYSTFPGFDESSRDFASEYPHLFDPDGDDTPAQVWDFIREGKQSAESANSESVAGRAAERLASLRNSVATELDDALSFGFGANVPEDDSF